MFIIKMNRPTTGLFNVAIWKGISIILRGYMITVKK